MNYTWKICRACGGSKCQYSFGQMQIFPCDDCLGYGYVEIEPNEERKNTMNYSTAVLLVNPNIRAVKGQYEENGKPEIFKTIDQSLKVGDFAVVTSGTRWGYTVVKISETDVDVDFDSPTQIGWVVQQVDSKTFEEIKNSEAQAINLIKSSENRKRREDIKKNMLDAVAAGEINNLSIARLGAPQTVDAEDDKQSVS